MNKRNLTANQIDELGIEALSSKLGTAGMIRFLHQHKMGKGNYSVDRHQWLNVPDVETLANQIQQAREEADTKTNSDSEEIAETSSREILHLTLNFTEGTKTEAPVDPLSEILRKYQQVVNRIGMVLVSSNRITKNIKRSMQISLLEVRTGSFDIRLAPTESVDLSGKSDFGNAIEEFMKLLNAGSGQDELKELLGGLRSKVAKDYTEFLKSLSRFVTDTKFTWASPNPGRGETASLSNLQMLEVIEILQRFQEGSSSTLKITGTLVGISLRSKRFEIKTKQKTYTGRVADEAIETVSKATLSQEYIAEIQETTEKSEATDEITKTKYQLLSLKIINGSQN